jgi:hypothetical protein
MSSKRISVMVVFMVLVAAVVITAVVLISRFTRRTEPVALPPEQSAEGRNTGGEAVLPTSEGLPAVDVTADTVRRVVATLNRSEEYVRTITVGTYWSGGSSFTELTSWVSGSDSALSISGDRTKHVLIVGDSLYIWYEGDVDCYSAVVSEDSLRLADEYQMLITWEDIVNLPDGAISDADYVEFGNEPCIFVRYTSGRLGYETSCWVSAVSGLVVGAEIYDGSFKIYDMRALSLEEGAVPDSVFDLPDGTNARSVSSDSLE